MGILLHSPPHKQFLIQRCSHCFTAVTLLGDFSIVTQPHLERNRELGAGPRESSQRCWEVYGSRREWEEETNFCHVQVTFASSENQLKPSEQLS